MSPTTSIKVSIIIPVYNGSNFLQEAIDSVLDQSYENKEILVINDGSNDGGKTEAIALSYGNKIRYFSKENGGVTSALNMAIKEMTGDYFSWLSHDDLYCKDKIERQVKTLLNLGEGKFIIYSDYSVFTGDPSSARTVKMEGVSPKNFRYWLTTKNYLHGCTLLIPKEAFEECGNFDDTLIITHDTDLWFRMAKSYRFVHLAEVLVKGREHHNQVIVRLSERTKSECDELMVKFINNLSVEEILAATKDAAFTSYNYIAESMRVRGFNNSTILANKIAMKYDKPSKVKLFSYTNKKSTVKTLIKNILKYILPPNLFFSLKDSFRKAGFLPTQIDYTEKELKAKFTEIYDKNVWGDNESCSGEGSNSLQTQAIKDEIPKVVKEFQIKTFLDAPCGDWYWMKEIDLEVEKYIGCDIVEPLIEKNRQKFASDKVTFEAVDLSRDSLPEADLVFSRDLLVHLNFEDAFKVIANFKKSGARYLLTTTYTTRIENPRLPEAITFWYPINLEKAPFNFPKPILLINEGSSEGGGEYADKSLGLWLLKDIKLPQEWY